MLDSAKANLANEENLDISDMVYRNLGNTHNTDNVDCSSDLRERHYTETFAYQEFDSSSNFQKSSALSSFCNNLNAAGQFPVSLFNCRARRFLASWAWVSDSWLM